MEPVENPETGEKVYPWTDRNGNPVEADGSVATVETGTWGFSGPIKILGQDENGISLVREALEARGWFVDRESDSGALKVYDSGAEYVCDVIVIRR